MATIELTIVENKLFMDERLSMEGLRLLAKLTSHSNGGLIDEMDLNEVRKNVNLDINELNELLNELIERGYLRFFRKHKLRSANRQWSIKPAQPMIT
ncbi:hypothetical protein [Marinobacterium aestuariivivens]|uniref:Uncharacterized protein n=1 Tax=Marinobacterium aestuariivivens TaxID=1698799 RepID=A0ABW2AA86_9GAMM